ncbi:MAG: isoprenylcysteine carboxylmethyltransferase family protein [Candidatus Nanopelagicales bacterium]
MATGESEATHRDRTTAWLLVGGQMALLAVLARLPRGTSWSLPRAARGLAWVGQGAGVGLSAVAAAGLGPGLSASPLPNEQAELHTDGLYAYVRHPIYAGVLLAATSRTLASGNRVALLPLGLLGVLLHLKAGFEERHLAERFPGYADYASHTPRILPTPASILARTRAQ